MEILKNKILKDGKVINNDILKVDSFLNHQVDCNLMKEIGKEFSEYFKNSNITKVVTVESSGISPAIMVAIELNVPMVIFKKQSSKTLNEDFYQTQVRSFTKDTIYNLTVSKKYLSSQDNILIIDDFLATGEAAKGIIKLINLANANVSGIGIVIEKSFQTGRKLLEKAGYNIYSLARIKSLNNNTITFFN